MKKTASIAGILILLLLTLSACNTAEKPPATSSAAETPQTPESVEAATAVSEPTSPPQTDTTEATAVPAEETTAVPETPAETETPTTGTAVSYNGISFSYDPALAGSVTSETIAGPEQAIDGPGWNNPPTYDNFTFEDYILGADVFPTPAISIYPAKEAASRSPEAKAQIEALQALLDTQPDPENLPDSMPALPIFNAAQVFYAQFDWLPFASGNGIRYVTMYAQDINPITNHSIFYTYQGLTSDGEYVVSAIFPVRSDALPDDIPSDFDWNAYADNYAENLAQEVALIESLADGDFTPDLAMLDAVMQSVTIEKEPAPKQTDANGDIILTILYPVNNGVTQIGDILPVAGYVAPDGAASVDVALTAGTNTLITGTAVVNTASGDWQTELSIPPNVIGRGSVVAQTDSEETSVTLFIREAYGIPPQAGDISIRMLQPFTGETAVSGYPVYFEGTVENPINNIVSVGMLIDGCTRWAARQDFGVQGSAAWTGVILLPENISDEAACAVAYTGTYGEGEWRETQTQVAIVAPDDERAALIKVEQTSLSFPAGGVGFISGYAVGADEVEVTLIDPATGETLDVASAPVGRFGLWEIELPIPADAPDYVTISVARVIDGEVNDVYPYMTGASVTR